MFRIYVVINFRVVFSIWIAVSLWIVFSFRWLAGRSRLAKAGDESA